MSPSTRVPNGVYAYAFAKYNKPIEVLKLHEGPSGITASDEIGTDIEDSEIATPEEFYEKCAQRIERVSEELESG